MQLKGRLIRINEQLDANSTQESTLEAIHEARFELKKNDFLLRYLEPTAYKKINGPLSVEWETEVFEKHEKPYKREGAGLTIAEQTLEDYNETSKSEAKKLIQAAISSLTTYSSDSIQQVVNQSDNFYFANRLFLLNLATIYTSGFECPDTSQIIPELKSMMSSMEKTYELFNQSFSSMKLSNEYGTLFSKTVKFVKQQSNLYSNFDHFEFIKSYVNPLFKLNQAHILNYGCRSKNMLDYSLSNTATSIFDKAIYNGQYTKGVYSKITDKQVLAEIESLGKQLFFDPILSGNNNRSCASCHSPSEGFTQNKVAKSLHFNGKDLLERNSPSLFNVTYNHLIMLDGAHITLQDQALVVMTNPDEMNGSVEEILSKVLSCKSYQKTLKKLAKYTPQEKNISIKHITSAITYYYGKFGNYYAPFDEAMNHSKQLSPSVVKGFNLFMSKAQCATCHFAPQFNGVKPPYVGSEFEVLGVPLDTNYTALDKDLGRAKINPAFETNHAFRTGTLKNIAKTGPYMHNGVFATLDQVIDFYDVGGGNGKGFNLSNQTLSDEKLNLSKSEKQNLKDFLESLTEEIPNEIPPNSLPTSKKIKTRTISGTY